MTRTLVVEQMNCLGGIATAGGHNHLCLYSSRGTDELVAVDPIRAEPVTAGTIDGCICTEEDIAHANEGRDND